MSEIYEEMESAGLSVPDAVKAKFNQDRVAYYYHFLLETDKTIGLFSKADVERVLDRHLYESMMFVHHLTESHHVSRETKVADVGTGPGLPGMLFACMNEPPALTLMDSSRRKTEHLQKAVEASNLFEPIHFVYGRAEEFQQIYSVIVSRAVVPFPHMAEVVHDLMGVKSILAMAVTAPEKSKRVEKYLTNLGIVSRETIALPELAFLGERSIIVLSKERSAKKGYPRPWKKIKEEVEAWRKS